jgi:hypothetical protein
MPSGGSRVTPCHSSNGHTFSLHIARRWVPFYLPRGGVLMVEVEGRWSAICCKRAVAVAVFIVRVVVVGEGGGGGKNGCPSERVRELISVTPARHCEQLRQSGGLSRQYSCRKSSDCP